jgi:MYXO-CTERM domain-containing protein
VKSSTGGRPGPTTTIPVRPVDSDGDGLLDPRERAIGTDPQDADSDDDGVLDGAEPGAAEDSDGDGRINALDPDSDNDGLIDGTELGLGCGHAQTDNTKGICRADADAGATKTDPRNRDTDGGSKLDGAEDVNHDGKVDLGETDPNNPADDKLMLDSDGDGLPDDVERMIGSDPFDADSDDDGARDGAEVMPAADSDGDGRRNVLDPDSDNDGLFDGTELGFGCTDPATNAARGFCIPDADMAASRTDPLRPDTDGGGAADGAEDANHNGAIDAGERNPLDPKDDFPMTPADAGTIDTGAAADTGGGLGGAAGADAGDAGGDAAGATDLGSTGTEAEVGVMADAGTNGPDGLGTTDIDGGLVPGADGGVGGAAGAGGTMAGAGEGGASGAAGSGPGTGDPMTPGTPAGPMSRDGRIGGGGCSCEVGGVGAGEGGGTAALAGLVVFAAVFRRRRERRNDARGALAKAGSK